MRRTRETGLPCKAEVCDFDAALHINKEVLGLEVTVDNTAAVGIEQTLKDLIGVALGFRNFIEPV